MIGELERLRLKLQPLLHDQPVDEGAVVLDRHIKLEIPVITAEGVEAVGAGGHDALDLVTLDCLNVFSSHHLVEVLIAELPHRLAAALLLLAKDTNLHTGSRADTKEFCGNLPVASVERRIAASEIENIDITLLLHDADRKPLRPISPRSVGHTKRIAVHLDIARRGANLVTREFALHEGQVTAHFENLVDVLDIGRANVLAGAAGRAGPECISRHRLDETLFR